MTAIEKALAWTPIGVRACLEEINGASSGSDVAALKLLGELLLIGKAIGESMRETLELMRPQLRALLSMATSSTEENYAYARWQLIWLTGRAIEPPNTPQFLAWEAKYFLELAGIQSYSNAFWRQAAAQALYGAMTDDMHIRTHLYNFTHAVFYGSDFGRREDFGFENTGAAILPAISEMLAASQEWDLYYEVQAARAMVDLLPPSWLQEVQRMDALPGQNIRGWIESSPEEDVLFSNQGAFDNTYAAVHSTLVALLAVYVSRQRLYSNGTCRHSIEPASTSLAELFK